jgi:uncharacterized membrane protein HdeD (DUF308 family)
VHRPGKGRAAPGSAPLAFLSAALSILLGVPFAANPSAGGVGIAVLLGITALVWGSSSWASPSAASDAGLATP